MKLKMARTNDLNMASILKFIVTQFALQRAALFIKDGATSFVKRSCNFDFNKNIFFCELETKVTPNKFKQY